MSSSVEHMKIPKQGKSETLLKILQTAMRVFDVDYSKGFVLAYVFKYTSDLDRVQKDAYMRFMSENGLDPTSFPSLLQFETQCVSMMASHLHAPPTAAGSFTSGGTESCMCAMIAARNWSREVRGVRRPTIVLPRTAHPAFHKAAYYMDLPTIIVEVDTVTLLPDVENIRQIVTKNKEATILVGSAGSYSHGNVDPIEGMAKIAKELQLWLHVDGCIGGFVLQYFRDFGADIPIFDFRLEGVSSMSVDLHKYAFACKGASTVIYRTRALRKFQLFSNSQWIGYPMINTTVQSTKCGGPMAAAWATLQYMGEEGYRTVMRDLYEGTIGACEGIKKIPGLRVCGQAKASLVAFTTENKEEVSVFHIQDAMKKFGWHVQAQPTVYQYEAHMHISVNPQMKKNLPFFLECLQKSVEISKKKTKETKAQFDADAAYVKKFVEGKQVLTSEDFRELSFYIGLSTTEPPKEGMARLNNAIETLPVPMRENLMISFFNDLMVHDEVVARQQLQELKGLVVRKSKTVLYHAVLIGVLVYGYKRLLKL